MRFKGHQVLITLPRLFLALIALCFTFMLTGCNFGEDQAELDAKLKAAIIIPEELIKPTPKTVIKVAYSQPKGSAMDVGMHRWKDEAELRSYGTLSLELYPDNKLGTDAEVIKRIENGEMVITFADSDYMFERGEKDMTVFAAPFLINNWDEAHRLTNGDWYKQKIKRLLKEGGIRVLSHHWQLGTRHILSTTPINSLDDIAKLNIAVPDDTIHFFALKYMGTSPKTLYRASDVRSSFATKSINSIETTINDVYDNKYYDSAKYLLLTSHMYKMTNAVISEKVWRQLDTAQKLALESSCERASEFYSVIYSAFEHTILQDLEKKGLTITTPSAQLSRAIYAKSRDFYADNDMIRFWSSKLYTEIDNLKDINRTSIFAHTSSK